LFFQKIFFTPDSSILKSEDAFFMRRNNRHPYKAMALMSAILSQLVGSILIGIFSGRWLDRTLGTDPLFLIIGLLIGLAAGVYAMLRLVQHFFSGD
jgi:F0F1-type ATP synthase assembly protein I